MLKIFLVWLAISCIACVEVQASISFETEDVQAISETVKPAKKKKEAPSPQKKENTTQSKANHDALDDDALMRLYQANSDVVLTQENILAIEEKYSAKPQLVEINNKEPKNTPPSVTNPNQDQFKLAIHATMKTLCWVLVAMLGIHLVFCLCSFAFRQQEKNKTHKKQHPTD